MKKIDQFYDKAIQISEKAPAHSRTKANLLS